MENRTKEESRADREGLEQDIRDYIESGGHWRNLMPELGLKEFGKEGYLNGTTGIDQRAKKLAVDANQETVVQGVKLTAAMVRGAILDIAEREGKEEIPYRYHSVDR